MRRVFIFILGSALLLSLVVSSGGFFWLGTSLPQLTGEHKVAGINAPVRLTRNEDGVTHIWAENETDGYFALGYAHAQDRFWQMETMRRFGAGRLSEVMGRATLSMDRWMRTLGLYRLAENQVPLLGKPVQGSLEAYADGVNAWLNRKSGLLSPEFALFRYKPETWKPADSLVWGKIMATRLAKNFRDEIFRVLVANRIGESRMRELWPAYPPDGPTTLGEAAPALFEGLLAHLPYPMGTPEGASNFWAVGPDKSTTGGAIMANDPHLGFAAPIMWYLARVETPGRTLMGATVPGVPFHILGTNGRIAWGVTSAEADFEDLFIEKLSEDGSAYETPSGPAPLAVRREVIRIKDEEGFVHRVRATARGPLISDVRRDARQITGGIEALSLRATYLDDDDRTSEAFYRINHAENWAGFRAALTEIQSPVLNFVYADAGGTIAYRTAGNIPVRRVGAGVTPAPGYAAATGWSGFIPQDRMPELINPQTSMLQNANNRVHPSSYPYFISHDWAAGYRSDRISQKLGLKKRFSPEDLSALQSDNISLMARDILPLLLRSIETGSRSDRVLEALGNWDGDMKREAFEPLVFSHWVLNLNRLIHADELGPLSNSYLGMRSRFLKSVLTEKQVWCDDTGSTGIETCDDLIRSAYVKTLRDLEAAHGPEPRSWRWGAEHKAAFRHQVFTRVPLIRELSDIELESDGGNYTLNRGATRPNSPAKPFEHIHGPGFRAVYDLADIDNSRFMIATGQSGNILSRHYDNLAPRWRNGEYVRFSNSETPRDTPHAHDLRLNPARQTGGD